jgi:hypothetical protein
MPIRNRIIACALTILAYASAISPSARADEPDATTTGAMPAREQELLGFVKDIQKEYSASRTPTAAQEARVALQVRVIAYIKQSYEAENWVGTVNSRGTTGAGNAWITIDIGNGATISTWLNEQEDEGFGSLLRPRAPLFNDVKNARIGQPITFSGAFLKSRLASDEEMIKRPQFLMRFTSLKIAH